MQKVSVETPCGKVVGLLSDGVRVFRGVKYAEAKRFCPPVPTLRYDGVFDATKHGVCCPQMRAYWNEEHRFYCREFRKGM